MTDWGNFTPGPWDVVQRPSGYLDENGAEKRLWDVYGAGVPVAVGTIYGDSKANARLISKAYLIPRLEAALAKRVRLVESRSGWIVGDTEEANRFRDLLAELRQP